MLWQDTDRLGIVKKQYKRFEVNVSTDLNFLCTIPSKYSLFAAMHFSMPAEQCLNYTASIPKTVKTSVISRLIFST